MTTESGPANLAHPAAVVMPAADPHDAHHDHSSHHSADAAQDCLSGALKDGTDLPAHGDTATRAVPPLSVSPGQRPA
ncbi:hypothetical protein ACFQ2B_16625 [Streptomyces stramineus]